MDDTAEFWTEIEQVGRRRRIRRAIGALALALAVGGTMAGSSAGHAVADGADAPVVASIDG
jgi:hypothetical protein